MARFQNQENSVGILLLTKTPDLDFTNFSSNVLFLFQCIQSRIITQHLTKVTWIFQLPYPISLDLLIGSSLINTVHDSSSSVLQPPPYILDILLDTEHTKMFLKIS